ncbi:hypothetical protein [Liquorilactobacillus hordei]|uniref:Uncharacterized protein n=2 Tax=Liquorilactobacillus hordei TaxID=468911 RepID=A0A3S6QRQ1_9LACO|nr:hypothetical protein [Liquorilactobacillus hordei]AUJ30774.1 hypothetical protein BSQ49_11600 [Liquorilactobacillus hordei]MBZ2406066.1 hypothetical protein [Liquorilactobacillus hordei]
MSKKYIAEIVPLNSEVIGTKAHGKAVFIEEGDHLNIKIDMFDTPANMQHWEHFHGFPNGEIAQIATKEQDVNHDGFVDLPETEAVSGTTMVPFDNAPHHMHIPNDNYPISDDKGYFSYEINVPLNELQKKFKEVFGTDDLELDKRVIYVHGVPQDFKLPDTVAGEVGCYDTHVTLPIAVGKIVEVNEC